MMPNFLVIGAAKSGTGALCRYLGQHPRVFMSAIKEPMFFSVEGQPEIAYRGPGDRAVLARRGSWVHTLEAYQALFASVSTEEAIGEGSNWYLYDEGARWRILRYVPRVRLIAILRNPVDRAYSAFTMLLRQGRETTSSFAKALADEDARVRAGWEPIWHYRRMGFYYAQLTRYYGSFDPAQIHVVLYDDFAARPSAVMRDVYRFLGVDARFEPDVSARVNVSMVPKNLALQRFIAGDHPLKRAIASALPAKVRQRAWAQVAARNFTRPRPMPPAVRRHLLEIFRPDVAQLQDLIGRDLSGWLR